MPHLRERHIQQYVLNSLRWSPAVGVYGLRQVGKSTLVETISQIKHGIVESFDRDATKQISQNRPYEFCMRDSLLCVDECQKGPWIFPVIKDIIGTKRKPGQFLLTGSIRFTLKKEIQESLTGRLILFELLPFTLAEATHQMPATFITTAFEHLFKTGAPRQRIYDKIVQELKKKTIARKFILKKITRHVSIGGMPIPCFSRDVERRKQWFDGFFETMIARDLVLVDPGLSALLPAQGFSFFKRLAFMQGEELNYSELSTAAALGLDKTKRLVRALGALCLIDLVIPETYAEKSQKKMRVEWKDSGLWNYFSQMIDKNITLQDNQTAMSLFLSQELRFQLGMAKNMTQWTYYKSHNGANIPWIFRQGEKTIAMMYLPVENPNPYHYRALKQFVARTPHSYGFIFGSEKAEFSVLDESIILVPFTAAIS